MTTDNTHFTFDMQRTAWLLAAALSLSACGGGGGGGSSGGPSLDSVSEAATPNDTTATAQAVSNNVRVSGTVSFGVDIVGETEPNNSQRNSEWGGVAKAAKVTGNTATENSSQKPDDGVLIIGRDIVLGSLNSSGDSEDFFRYIPQNSGDVSILLAIDAPSTTNLSMEVLDSIGNVLASASSFSPDIDFIDTNTTALSVTAGVEYTIRVFVASGTDGVAYNLVVSDSNAVWTPAEPNESIDDVAGLTNPFKGNEIVVSDVTDGVDDSDYVKMTPMQSGLMSIYLRFNQHVDHDLDLYLYDSAKTLLASSDSLTTDERIYLQATAGSTYYWRVDAFDTGAPAVAARWVVAMIPAPAGATADLLDAYLFTAPATDTYSFTLNFDSQGNTKDLDLGVYNEDLSEAFTSFGVTGNSENVVIEIDEGEKFYVVPRAWNTQYQSTAYTLEITGSSTAEVTTVETGNGGFSGGGDR